MSLHLYNLSQNKPTEVNEKDAKLDDAATVLRTLSATNFNPTLECLVQVLKPEDRDILKDSEVDVILCLDEYKTCLQVGLKNKLMN